MSIEEKGIDGDEGPYLYSKDQVREIITELVTASAITIAGRLQIKHKQIIISILI